MAKITIKNNLNRYKEKLNQQRMELRKLPVEALDEFKNLTPEDTGNAKRRTRLTPRNEIYAAYPYASRLDEGYSDQAPQGMTEPFQKWLDEKLKQIMEMK